MQALTVADVDLTWPTTIGVIIGGLLIVAGIVWFFLMAYHPPPRERGATAAGNPLKELIDKFFEWFNKVTDKLPRRYLPGLVMIVLGVVVVALSIGLAATSDNGSDTPSPAVTT